MLKNKYYTKESIQFNYNIWYNIIKKGKVVEYMDYINYLLLLFIYFVVIIFSYAMDLVEWYKRGKHSVAFCILMVVGGILLLSVLFYMGYTFK